jgi:hypothetical protein
VDFRPLRSEEQLMLAVLEQAVADLDNSCPAVRADAEAYFFAYEPDSSAFSFDSVCFQFGFSPSAIRQALRRRPRHLQGPWTPRAAIDTRSVLAPPRP